MLCRLVSLSLVLLAHAAAQERSVPAFTGYAIPDASALSRKADGSIEGWGGALAFYLHCGRVGGFDIALDGVSVASSTTAAITFGIQPSGEGATHVLELTPSSPRSTLARFEVREPGYHRISLRAESSRTIAFAKLSFSGEAVPGVRAGAVERRNAASVHLGYEVPRDLREQVAWFYIELTPRTDPLWSYYMATGWHRGYFGMQVNSPTERRLIFSVWDSGDEAVDRSRVADADRVRLLAKGEDVYASGFGNEGTGGHSHLVHPWSLGDRFRFLVNARPDGDATIYTGWFWFVERGEWGLIASFRAPKDGRFLRGLYSFNENFAGENGDCERVCEFGNAWVRGIEGAWQPLLSARFTHDEHGEHERLDRSAGVIEDRWYLRNGGFTDDRRPGAVTTARKSVSRAQGTGTPPTANELQAILQAIK
ncbi:MAG: DUF3472 domain-containing protein [Planctomycetota bacterium]